MNTYVLGKNRQFMQFCSVLVARSEPPLRLQLSQNNMHLKIRRSNHIDRLVEIIRYFISFNKASGFRQRMDLENICEGRKSNEIKEILKVQNKRNPQILYRNEIY